MKKGIQLALATAGILASLTAFSGCGAKSEPTETLWPITEAFENIRIEVSVSDIQFTPSDDDSCKVLWLCDDSITQSVRVEDNTLVIQGYPDNRFSLSGQDAPRITVQLPQPEYRDLQITGETCDIDTTNYFTFRNVDIETSSGQVGCRCNVLGSLEVDTDSGQILIGASQPTSLELSSSSGSITLQSVVSTGTLEANTDAGQVYLSYVKAASAQVETNTGPVTLDNVLIDGHLDIGSDTGSVELRDADAQTLEIETSTGDITGNLLTDKTFLATSGTGSVSVPDTTGGECRLSSDTGDIEIQTGAQE